MHAGRSKHGHRSTSTGISRRKCASSDSSEGECTSNKHSSDNDSITGTSLHSTDSSNSDENSDTNSSGVSSIKSKGSSSASKSKKSKRKHGKHKLKSGRLSKVGDSVLKPEIWPHSKLSLQYAGKGLKFDELTMPLFVAGFIESLRHDFKHQKLNKVQNKLQHLKNLMYAATHQEWETILDLHSAIVLDIEHGNRHWGESTVDIESKILSSSNSKKSTTFGAGSSGINSSTGNNASGTGSNIYFCRQYQSGKCNKSKSHVGFVNGKKHNVVHICATCWLVERVQNEHSECSSDCKYQKR